MTTIETLIVKIQGESTDLAKGIGRAEAALLGFSNKCKEASKAVEEIGKKALTHITLPVIAAATVGVKAFADFDDAMRNTNVIAGESEAQFQKTSQAVLDMSTHLGVQPTALAEGLRAVTLAGQRGADALEVLGVAAQAGKAGLTDTATAAQYITEILKAYDLPASRARDVSDTLFKTMTTGGRTFTDVGASMASLSVTAKMAGVDFDVMAAALATMSKAGVPAEAATLSLNRLMMAFIKPSEKMQEALRSIGQESGAAVLKQYGLGAAMSWVEEKTNGSAEALAAMGFDTKSFKAAASLTANEGKNFAKSLGDIANQASRSGASLDAFAQHTKGFGDVFEDLKANLTVAFAEIGRALAPFIREVVEKLQEWISWWRSLDEETKNFYMKLALYAAAIGPILIAISGFIKLLGLLAAAIDGVAVAMAFLAANPIVLIIAGIVAIGAVVYKLVSDYNAMDEAQRKLVEECKNMDATYQKTTTSLANAMAAADKYYKVIENTPDAQLPDAVLDSYIAFQNQIQATYQAKLALEEAMKPGTPMETARAALAKYTSAMAETEKQQKALEAAMKSANAQAGQMKIPKGQYVQSDKDKEAQAKFEERLNKAVQDRMTFEEKMVSYKKEQASLADQIAKAQVGSEEFYKLQEKALEVEVNIRSAIEEKANKIREDAKEQAEVAKMNVGAAERGSVEAYKYTVAAQKANRLEEINKSMDEKLKELVKIGGETLTQLQKAATGQAATVVTIAP